ncbi:beta-lactamase family protein [Ophiocordyceps sinensis CO18]|nr:beta-lactamase family protein [Ophiocordyceps sinensis CO18]
MDPPRPCTADTLFNIASASKSLTAASVGLLVHDNVNYPTVQYNATMSSLLPDDFAMAEEKYTNEVTVEDILGHRSGIPRHDFSYLGPRATHPDDARSVTRNLRNLEIAYPIRAKYLYCNMMYTVASYLVEKMAGLPFADFLEQRFFRPLDMRSTNLQPERARAKGLGHRIATGYFWDEHGHKYRGVRPRGDPEAQGADSVITSVNDYIKWVRAMVNHEGPITRDVYDGLVRLRIIEDQGDAHLRPFTSPLFYSAGWETYYYRGNTVISHDGNDPGFNTYHFFLPELKSGGVILTNSDSGGAIVNILMREIIDEFLGVPVAERVDWKRTETKPHHAKDEDATAELLPKLCPGSKKPHPQSNPLGAYTGTYRNKGYHSLTVQISNGSLFVDAGDRSFPFTLTLEHLCNQTKYVAHMRFTDSPGTGVEDDIMAEFTLRNNAAARMGLELESDLPGLIWFDKVA